MPVPVPIESPVQSTGVLSWAEGDRTLPLLLAEVKSEWNCTSADPCMLSWHGQDTTLRFLLYAFMARTGHNFTFFPVCFHGVDRTQLYLLYLFTYIPGNVST
jgi:hypothetical protein